VQIAGSISLGAVMTSRNKSRSVWLAISLLAGGVLGWAGLTAPRRGHDTWKVQLAGPLPVSTLLSDAGLIVTADEANGIVAAYDAAGRQVWSTDLNSQSVRSTGRLALASLTSGADGTIYVATDENSLLALDAQGRFQWKYAEPYNHGHRVGDRPLATGGVLCSMDNGWLCKLTPEGLTVWRTKVGGHLPGYSLTCDAAGNAYCLPVSKKVCDLVSLSPDGRIAWRQQLGALAIESITSPAGVTAVVSATSTGGQFGQSRLSTYNPDGSLRWSKPLSVSCLNLGSDGRFYCLAAGRILALDDAGREEGLSTGQGYYSLSLHGDRLYAVAQSNNTAARLLWEGAWATRQANLMQAAQLSQRNELRVFDTHGTELWTAPCSGRVIWPATTLVLNPRQVVVPVAVEKYTPNAYFANSTRCLECIAAPSMRGAPAR
jgi:outer membrane protein assembly factor BamB